METIPPSKPLWNSPRQLTTLAVMIRRAFHLVVIATASAIALAATLPVLPKAQDAWRWLAAQDSPEALTQLQLAAPDAAERWQTAFREALEQEDLDLAASLLSLVETKGIVPDPAAITQYRRQ